jgi:hypothetical protein
LWVEIVSALYLPYAAFLDKYFDMLATQTVVAATGSTIKGAPPARQISQVWGGCTEFLESSMNHGKVLNPILVAIHLPFLFPCLFLFILFISFVKQGCLVSRLWDLFLFR